MPIATHQISLHGLSGAVFWFTLSAVIFYVLGFATVDWERNGSRSVGLWATCTSTNYHHYGNQDWFIATQAMATIGLALVLACLLTMFLYMFVHSMSINKSQTIMAFTILAFLAVVSMLVALSLFGAKHERSGDLNWSYAFSVIGGILTLIAGILGIVQMRESHVV